ncbi:hypothetical protein NUW58_g5509 [Xylaria curta]|uniref:Uncharacterized protein n=1 Tax=Xylaria curta TaxID=42375 RepID=A0ACC1P1C8_9PEZI|nr:hypothetical protein NUW58_g5509 [Xylaria curta]
MSFLARRLTTTPRLLGASRAFSASARRDIAKITLRRQTFAATPEIKATSTGKEVIQYSVASNDGPADNRRTSWFRVATFAEEGPRRDYLTSLPKGSTVFVEGDAVMSTYTDAEGKMRSSLRIYQRNLEVLRRGTPSE